MTAVTVPELGTAVARAVARGDQAMRERRPRHQSETPSHQSSDSTAQFGVQRRPPRGRAGAYPIYEKEGKGCCTIS